jgi:hypothetical protein
MQPDPSTAIILDNIVAQLNNITKCEDISLAISEFAMGYPTAVRNLDICFGFNQILNGYSITISNGTYRFDTAVHELSIISELVDNIDEKLGSIKLSNVYVCGNIRAYIDINDNNLLKFDVGLFRGGTGIETEPDPDEILFIGRDIDEDTIVNMVLDDTIVVVPKTDYLELYRFILSVNRYNVEDARFNDYKIIMIDMRKPRGWGGYAEEALAINMIPALLEQKDNIKTILTDNVEVAIKNMVDIWMKMAWSGGFDAYWNGNLPPNLDTYIQENF